MKHLQIQTAGINLQGAGVCRGSVPRLQPEIQTQISKARQACEIPYIKKKVIKLKHL